jgi:hypothetical protein
MNRFTVNGKTYSAKAFDFNLISDLEDYGVSLEKMQDKPMSMVRAYFSMCAGKGKEYAGNEIEQHIISGGKLDDIVNAMSKEMENSDFFRAIKERADEETSEDETQETETENTAQ